jgi:pyruvate/2-oxoglutarate dehydrogenase complex dihydrolipoamide acyltransferase (E2) component
MQGTVISLSASVSDTVRAGSEVAILEAMKMEHVIVAPVDGTIRQWASAPGDTLFEGHPILFVEPGEVDGDAETVHAEIDPDHIRGDLAEVLERHDVGLDHRRSSGGVEPATELPARTSPTSSTRVRGSSTAISRWPTSAIGSTRTG